MNVNPRLLVESETLDELIHSRCTAATAAEHGLGAGVVRLALHRRSDPPRREFVDELRAQLAGRAATPAAVDGAVATSSFAARPMRSLAAAMMGVALLVAAGAAGWSTKAALSDNKPPPGVAYPVQFGSLEHVQAAVVFRVLGPAPGAQAEWVRWYCMQFRDLPCSPQAAWVEARFKDATGREFTLKQGYFGVIAAGTVAQGFVPADRKGRFAIRGFEGYWIDCRGEAGAEACSSKDATGIANVLVPPGENIAARNQLAAVGWLAARENGSQRWVGLESSTHSPDELRAIADSLVEIAP